MFGNLHSYWDITCQDGHSKFMKQNGLEMVNNAVCMTIVLLKHVQKSWMITVQLVHKPRCLALTIPQA